jgi:hypothetical protein
MFASIKTEKSEVGFCAIAELKEFSLWNKQAQLAFLPPRVEFRVQLGIIHAATARFFPQSHLLLMVMKRDVTQ